MPSHQDISRNIIPPSAAGRPAAMPALSIHHINSAEIGSIMRGLDADGELMDDAISQTPGCEMNFTIIGVIMINAIRIINRIKI